MSGKWQITGRLKRRRAAWVWPILVLSLVGLFWSARAAAAFDPGNIIADQSFTASGTMSEAQIQSFLETKGGHLASYCETRDVFIGPEDNVPARGWRAAKIIWQVANWYGINPQVIIATLQKEQSLVTDPSPEQWALDWAMGYGCPDSGPCATYAGFARQVDMGSWQLRWNMDKANAQDARVAPYTTGNTVTIDGASVRLSNGATASLYRYTPHIQGNQSFYNIFNSWFPASIPVGGAIGDKHNSLQGAPGPPRSYEYAVYSAAGAWLGQAQDFQYGRIIWNQATGETYWVYGAILSKYDALGRESGFLGLPKSDEYGAVSGRAHNFAGGRLYWSSATGPHVVYGAILAKLVAEGDVARLGFPVNDEIDVTGVPGARESSFSFGRIYWSPNGAAHVAYGAILGRYLQLGGPAALGLPTGDEADIPGRAGSRQQSFGSGNLYWSGDTGARPVVGAILNKYLGLGGPSGGLGLPVADPYAVAGGQAQSLQNGLITSSEGSGVHVAYGAILGRYLQLEGPAGPFGLAVSDEIDAPGVPGARESDFQRGRIYWSSATGAHFVNGAILASFLSNGGSAVLGIPVSDEFDAVGVPGARESDFQRGRILWSAATDAHMVYGAILARWLTFGASGGGLGLPISDEHDVAGVSGARQSHFKNGRIYWSSATDSHAVHGGILQKYLELGGPASRLGLPVSEEYGYRDGRRSDFQGGYIFWSTGGGARDY